ncbi:MAG: hypothetical protein C5B57_08520, partial [Blastocatellia bacterium]
MRFLHRAHIFLREWLHQRAVDEEFGEELAFHLHREIQNNLDAGMTLEQARRAARLAVGHLESIREESRTARRGAMARQAVRDVGYGWRLLRKTPG